MLKLKVIHTKTTQNFFKKKIIDDELYNCLQRDISIMTKLFSDYNIKNKSSIEKLIVIIDLHDHLF